ncbi:unnamed protein product, partial [Rotaria socialis]
MHFSDGKESRQPKSRTKLLTATQTNRVYDNYTPVPVSILWMSWTKMLNNPNHWWPSLAPAAQSRIPGFLSAEKIGKNCGDCSIFHEICPKSLFTNPGSGLHD